MRSYRLVHLAVATLLSAAAATTFGLITELRAAPGDTSSFVPIVPCRLFDTRADQTVGTRATKIGHGQEVTFAVWGSNGNCTIPNTATGIASNVTTVNPTNDSFLAVFPADAARPLSSNLNWIPTSPPTPNQVTVSLSAAGAIKVYNNNGSIDVVLDIVGYYVPAAPGGNATFDSGTAATTAAVQADFADVLGGTLIRDLTLPAGSYDIKATTSVRGATDGPAAPALNTRVRCNLVNATAAPAVSLDTFYQDFFQPDEAAPGFREDLEVGALVTFAAPTKVELRCYSVRPNGGTLAGQIPSSKIIATQVATITPGN